MLAVLFYSCKSIPNPNQEYMYVMIYDYYNNGVKNVSIYLDDKIIGRTDVYGRFSFPIKNDNSKHTLSLQKDNYEKITDTIFYTRNEVLYYKMGESFFYFEEAEKQFDSKNYDYALKNIKKALTIEKRKDYEYMKNLIEKKLEKETAE